MWHHFTGTRTLLLPHTIKLSSFPIFMVMGFTSTSGLWLRIIKAVFFGFATSPLLAMNLRIALKLLEYLKFLGLNVLFLWYCSELGCTWLYKHFPNIKNKRWNHQRIESPGQQVEINLSCYAALTLFSVKKQLYCLFISAAVQVARIRMGDDLLAVPCTGDLGIALSVWFCGAGWFCCLLCS